VIKAGELAPDFTAEATDGRVLTLSALRGTHVVLYFFPKAFTPG
jgi:thioredoxin-dependent peroxiredoxin